ncbi:MAG: hypothetical protein ACOC1P_05210 [Minisyncoccales bacterium]
MVRGYKPPVPLKGHVFSYGKTDSGKTWKNLAITQYYYEQGYKIWDIYGGLRREGPFWCFPSDEITLWRNFLKNAGIDGFTGPKEYNVDLYIPYFKSKVPKEIPEKLPRIKSNVFTINFKDLTTKDISVVIGNVTNNQERILKRIKNELPYNANGEDILNWFNETKTRKKMKRFPIYYAFFEPLCKEQLFEGKNGKFILDFKKIAKEKERIFVFVEDYISEEVYRFFFIHYLMRKIFELVNDDKIHKQNILLLREINSFMKIDDESSQYREQKQNLRNEFSNLLRYGRSGVFAICDTQSPKEVRGITPGQEGILCLNRLPGEKDREEACERPRKGGRMNSTHVAYLGTMPIQEMAVLEQGKTIRKINHVQPPRTMGWKPDSGRFTTVWKRKYNEYKDIQDIKEKIEKMYQKSRELARLLNDEEDEDYSDENQEIPVEEQQEKKLLEEHKKKLESEKPVVNFSKEEEINEDFEEEKIRIV